MKHSILWTIIAVFAISIASNNTAMAQDKRKLTLQEAIDLSIKNSKQLKGNQARVEEATAALKEAVERKLPDVNATGSYLRLNSPNVDLKVKPTNNGGGGSSNEAGGKVSQAAYAMVNASLPIYSGLRIKYGIESARYLQKAAELDADNNKEAVVLNTIDAYNNLYKAKAAVDLVNESLQQARQRVKQFANLEKNGLLARNDFLKAQLQASNTELSLLDAENNWELSNINMDLMLGLPEATELQIDTASMYITPQLKTIDDYVQLGLQNRKDLAALDYREKAAATGVKATQGEKYPSLALTSGYVAVEVPNLLTVYNAVNIGLGVQYSVSSLWKNSAKVQQAKARQNQVAANEEALTDAIRLQINQAYQNYLVSQKKIDVYATAVTQATENYKIVKNKYDNGLATVTDLLEADVAQLQAKLNYAFAQSDAVVSYDKLLQTAGMLTRQ